MQVRFWLDQANRVIVSRYAGMLTARGIRGDQALIPDPWRFDASTRRLIDGRQIESTRLSARELQFLGRWREGVAEGPLAIIADSAALFGMGRMAATWYDSIRPNIQVFRDTPTALDWLGLPMNYLDSLGLPQRDCHFPEDDPAQRREPRPGSY